MQRACQGGSNQVSNALLTMTASCDSDALRTTRHYRVLDWDLKDGLFTEQIVLRYRRRYCTYYFTFACW